VKKTLLGAAAIVICGTAMAENITGSDQIICSAGSAQICIEASDCYAAAPSAS
jgi:hypothetical protein